MAGVKPSGCISARLKSSPRSMADHTSRGELLADDPRREAGEKIEADGRVMIKGGLLDRAPVGVELFGQPRRQHGPGGVPPPGGFVELRQIRPEHVQRGGLSNQVVVRAGVVLEMTLDEASMIEQAGEPFGMEIVVECVGRQRGTPTTTKTCGRPARARRTSSPRCRRGCPRSSRGPGGAPRRRRLCCVSGTRTWRCR